MSAEFEVTITDKDMFHFNIYHAYHGFQGIIATVVGVWVLIMAGLTFGKIEALYTVLYLVLGIVCLVYVPGNLYLRSQLLIYSSRVNAYIIPKEAIGEQYQTIVGLAINHLEGFRLKLNPFSI